MKRPLICGFLKVRNEVLRSTNVYRAIPHLRSFCDTIVACDDASTDGTRQYLQREIPPDQLLLVSPEEQDFRRELEVKQRMMEMVHKIQPHWIWWHDADEELEPKGVKAIRAFCESQNDTMMGFRFHYTQLWRNALWARTDDGFDDGWFVKLWRWSPGLRFNVVNGTHHNQFPEQLASAMDRVGTTPWEVIHWGNWGVNLRWKCIQYWGGLGGVDRHMNFEDATYRPLKPLPAAPAGPRAEAAVAPPGLYSTPETKPKPFTKRDKVNILSMKNLKGLDATFTVVIPTFNRAKFLTQTLESLQAQTYTKWVAMVLDDGSTDETPSLMERWQERDQRVFYGRYPKMGAVAINEIGMDIACEASEYWTRLGSDDYFEPHKLMLDAMALSHHGLCYGPYRALKMSEGEWQLREMCNLAEDSVRVRERLTSGQFLMSWANMACRTAVLKKIKAHYGNYCSPTLRNMEDFHVNSRLVRFAKPVWRGAVEDCTLVNPGPELQAWIKANTALVKHDAIWRENPIGASADGVVTSNDDALTLKLIEEESRVWKDPAPRDPRSVVEA